MVKVYIAGPLCQEEEREFLEKIDELCRELGFKTFLPYRDVGILRDVKDFKKISKRDVEELDKCDVMVGILNGICVGAGTAWEMGYFQALGKKVIGLKTDRKVRESISDISVVIAGEVEIVESLEELREGLEKNKN